MPMVLSTAATAGTTTKTNRTELVVEHESSLRSSQSPTVLQERLFERFGIPVSETFMISDEDESLDPDTTEEKKEEPFECVKTAYLAANNDRVVAEIKTLVWEVVAIKTTKNYAAQQADFVTKSSQTFYVVSALQVKDKVDLPKLKSLVLKEWIERHGALDESTQQQYQHSKWTIQTMQLAPLQLAEAMTGFQSGCMPPICHTADSMNLYLDRSIVDMHQQSSHDGSGISFASIGSGIPGKSLIFSLQDFLAVAGISNVDKKDSTRDANSLVTTDASSCTVGNFSVVNQSGISMTSSTKASVVDESNPSDFNSQSGNGITSNELKMMSGPEIKKLRQDERKQQREARKDRLREYRSFRKDDILSKAKLFRTTARKKGRIEEMEILIQEALDCGDFAKLMEIPDEQSPDTNIDKNALHICAWRGDFETVVRLIDISKQVCPELDVVNLVSKGPGNYGKTPIFFALTQCREDVVKYLVQEAGADLLIVNNKGQTPCSIARSHMTEETCQLLYETEAEQLRQRSTTTERRGLDLFLNYRASEHSDGKLYGDLDPRFPIDDANRYVLKNDDKARTSKTDYDPKIFVGKDYMDRADDLSDQLKAYESSVLAAPEESIIYGIPTIFSPRSFRPTVRWWKREDRSLSAANEKNSGGQITFTQSRKAFTKKNNEADDEEGIRSKKSVNHHQRSSFNENIDIDSLESVSVEDCFGSNDSLNVNNLILVDDAESLKIFETTVNESLSEVKESTELSADASWLSTDDEQILLQRAWGLDCEWKPGPECGVDSHVSTLQLSTGARAFLIDLQTICRTDPESDEDNSVEKRLDDILTKLFRNSQFPLVGFGILQDLGKLAASFSHLDCFSYYSSVMDLQSISTVVYKSKRDRRFLSSLQKMTAALLEKRLDKTQQVSDWSNRPLTEEQLIYAMLDAAILPRLLKEIVDGNEVIEGYNGRFFKVHSNLLSTIRYTPVTACPEGFVYEVEYGSIKSTLGKAFARQTWATAMKLEPPDLPKLVSFGENLPSGDDDPKRLSKKERAHLKKIGGMEQKRRPKPIPLKNLSGNLENLPTPGISLGYTKESCAFRVVGHELFQTIPEGTYIGFNRRAGVVETSNAWIIFCNFGGDKAFSKFTDNGRRLSFRVSSTAESGRASEASLYRYMMSAMDGNSGVSQTTEDEKKIILFARESTRSKYMYCGFCSCSMFDALDPETASLLLDLEDYEILMNPELRISSDFEQLISNT